MGLEHSVIAQLLHVDLMPYTINLTKKYNNLETTPTTVSTISLLLHKMVSLQHFLVSYMESITEHSQFLTVKSL